MIHHLDAKMGKASLAINRILEGVIVALEMMQRHGLIKTKAGPSTR